MTTRYLPDGLTTMPVEQERRVPLQVDQPVEREDDVGRRQRVAVREVHVRLQVEVNVFAPFDAFHEETSSGTGCARSPLL